MCSQTGADEGPLTNYLKIERFHRQELTRSGQSLRLSSTAINAVEVLTQECPLHEHLNIVLATDLCIIWKNYDPLQELMANLSESSTFMDGKIITPLHDAQGCWSTTRLRLRNMFNCKYTMG